MATDVLRRSRSVPAGSVRPVVDETKASFKTTEFWAMAALIAAILIASAVSDSLDDVRAWTLVAAVGIGYMLSRGLAKAGSTYRGGEDFVAGGNPARGVTSSSSDRVEDTPQVTGGTAVSHGDRI